MLNKAGYFILAVLVLCTTTGIVVNQHYSNGALYSASIYSEPDSCCGQEEEEQKDTCHEQTKVYKVKNFFLASNPVTIQVHFQTILHKTNIPGLFSVYKPVTFFTYTKYNLFKPKIPKPELLQVFIL